MARLKHRMGSKSEHKSEHTGDDSVKWLEIIKLRSAESGEVLLGEFLRLMTKASQNGLIEMKTYRHAALETDLSVHLHWDSERPEQNGSTLGLRLAQAFKDLGLTDHSVWVEETK